MVGPAADLVGHFIDLAVSNPSEARALFRTKPQLLHARWIHGETPLHFLVVEGYLEAVRTLAELGFDVNAKNEFGDTALIDAVALGNLELVDLLLRNGANPNAPSEIKTNALHCAMQFQRWPIAKRLLQAGAKTDYTGQCGEVFEDVLPQDGAIRDELLAEARAGSGLKIPK